MENTNLSTSDSDNSKKEMTQSRGLIFRNAFLKRKAEKPYYFTMQNVAKRAGVSPAYLSRIFQGERPPSLRLTQKLVRVLEYSSLEQLEEEFGISSNPKAAKRNFAESRVQKVIKKPKKNFINYYDDPSFSLNDQWYYIALLDLTTCSNFQSSPQWIAKRLGISKDEVTLAISELEKAGLLKVENGTMKKINNDLVIPTVSSREKIRHYHKVMSLKAIEIMEQNVSSVDFQKRLIKGSTIAANPDRLEIAKNLINKALIEVIETLSEGDCTELYHFNLQLFPLLNTGDEK